MANKQGAGFHGVDSPKYAVLGGDAATVKDAAYVVGVSLSRQISKTQKYANNRMVCEIASDNGYTGTINTTAPELDLETALGMVMNVAGGARAVVSRGSTPRADVYFETIVNYEDGTNEVVKTWLLNVAISEPESIEHSTDTNSATFGDYAYPITVYGEMLKASTGDADYVDDKGFKRRVYRLDSYPGDEGYTSFGSTVPAPKMATA